MSITNSGLMLRSAILIAADGRNPAQYNSGGLPRISDEEHFKRAIESSQPHTYLAQRAGRISFKGEDGLGHMNAEQLHVRVFRQRSIIIDNADIGAACTLSPSFRAAVSWIKVHEPAIFKKIENAIPPGALPKPSEFYLR